MALSDERAALTPAVMARYWAKINKNGPLWNGTPCWVWTACTSKRGYGQIGVKVAGRHIKLYAHRIALMLVGRMREGMESCHRCNRPCCCNPAHLYAGTHQQNMRQAWDEGIVPPPLRLFGEAHPRARLSDVEVCALREQRAAGAKLIDLADEWGHDFTSVSDICRGKTRRSAGGPLTRCFTCRTKVVAS